MPSPPINPVYSLPRTNLPIQSLTPNILPCHLHHNGPTGISKRYWNPQKSPTTTTTRVRENSIAYFRGRKLCSRALKLPAGYQGVLLRKTDRDERAPSSTFGRRSDGVEDEEQDLDDGEEDTGDEVKTMEVLASFGQVIVWGHDAIPEDGDEYVKGIEEWMGFAAAVSDASVNSYCPWFVAGD
ncbi:hypothetical protein LTR62_005999 [Meristemomyces frigidus]|uniref:Uncharacterized protein n=1 Tax=Meristemomyces frigidus TaxID=1508187 RepID=A0AAN7YTH0_9PEZI|nr:hypothetical protein LTR62_005999 [Meristemomyces frigidus]